MAVNAAGSSSTYVNNPSSSKGFSGLASGVDTESMVEQLLSGTQSKIDKQEGAKQQLLWKQEIYREIISKINSFQAKFFSYSSSSNLASASFWNSLSVLANSSAFKATATSSASTGTSSISVRRLATKSSLTSGMSVSGNLSGSMDADALKKLTDAQLDGDYTVKFKVGDTAVDVDLTDVFVKTDETGKKSFITYSSTTSQDNAIQKKLQEAFDKAEAKATVTVKDGALTIVNKDFSSYAQNITVEGGGELGLERLGLTANTGAVKTSEKNANTNIETVTYTLSGKVDAVPKMQFSVTLDDLKKDITIDLRKVLDTDGKIDKSAFMSEMETAIGKAHGTGQVKVKETADGGFALEVSAGRKVDVGGAEDVMSVLGMKNGASNRISLGSKLSDLNLGAPLRGSDYRFTINGEEFHFTGDTALIDVMDVINRSDAGVRMVYRAQDDKFVLEAKEYGAGKQIQMSQSSGNLLTALFGVGGDLKMSPATSSWITSYEPAETKGKTFKMPSDEVPDDSEDAEDGATKTVFREPDQVTLAELKFTVDDEDNPGNTKDVYLTDLIPGLDGDKKLSELGDLGYEYSMDKDGNITIKKLVDDDTTLGDLGYTLNGIDGVDENTKLSELTDPSGKLTVERNSVGFRFVLNGYYAESADADTVKTLNSLFGTGTALGRDPGKFTIVDGQNSEIEIDGFITERSSNNFNVNGVNYDISDLTGSYSAANKAYDADTVLRWDDDEKVYIDDITGKKYAADQVVMVGDDAKIFLGYYLDENGDKIDERDLVLVDGEYKKFTGKAETVTVKQDTDTIINAVKEFVDEYNILVKTLNDLLDEDTNYRDYPPLTSAQKAEMSDREIELWEQKAKEGLLHRDTTIQDFLQQMRTALYQKPQGSRYALYELGIETGEWEMKGQLSFVGGDALLRNLLENDPSGVANLFTGINGLGTTLNDILKATASTSSGSPGTLVQIAGVKGSDKNSSMYEQMKKIDDKIEALKRQYEMEKTRYWNQFNTMEQMISNMNTQSAYLAQMMGMSY